MIYQRDKYGLDTIKMVYYYALKTSYNLVTERTLDEYFKIYKSHIDYEGGMLDGSTLIQEKIGYLKPQG